MAITHTNIDVIYPKHKLNFMLILPKSCVVRPMIFTNNMFLILFQNFNNYFIHEKNSFDNFYKFYNYFIREKNTFYNFYNFYNNFILEKTNFYNFYNYLLQKNMFSIISTISIIILFQKKLISIISIILYSRKKYVFYNFYNFYNLLPCDWLKLNFIHNFSEMFIVTPQQTAEQIIIILLNLVHKIDYEINNELKKLGWILTLPLNKKIGLMT